MDTLSEMRVYADSSIKLDSGSVNFLSAVQVLYLSFLLIDSHAYAMLMFAVVSNI